jgi:hypothetical protein
MSIVIVDVDNDYCEDLRYSYQLTKDEQGLYSVYINWGFLRGEFAARRLESFADAMAILLRELAEREDLEVIAAEAA